MRVGEKVRFLNEVGEATVLRILPNGIVEVEDEYGLVTSHAARELISIEKSAEPETPIAPQPPRPEPKRPETAPPSIQRTSEPLPEIALIFAAEGNAAPEASDLELFFHNGTEYHMLVNVAAKEERGLFSLFSGEVRAGETQAMRPIRRQDVDIFGLTMVDCIFFKEADYVHREAFSATLKLKSTRFVKAGSYQLVSEIGSMAIVVPIVQPALKVADSAAGLSISPMKKPAPKTRLLPVFDVEIDLHIEMLVTDHAGMSEHEMLLCQLKCADREINRGLANGLISVTFIHGIGKGRLRDEVRALAAEYGLRCEAGAFQKYGAGATVVFMSRG
jgi:hypothetical protein